MEKTLGMKTISIGLLMIGILTLLNSCKDNPEVANTPEEVPQLWYSYDETGLVSASKEEGGPNYSLIQSRFQDKQEVFEALYSEAMALSEARYGQLKSIILEQPVTQLQDAVARGEVSYEEITRFYLRRIFKYELDSTKTLNAIIALNPDAVQQARDRDYVIKAMPAEQRHPIFGMPVLVKDNIGVAGMPTTAGAAALADHSPENAFIAGRLKARGAIVLGKLNMSEWAYFFCQQCPSGYSAVGGQTLNPYGRTTLSPGGSSSGSGAAIAAGYAFAAIGTETSGSILSPSSQNGLVGLKPSVGMLSRSGIVPISKSLDTPGPMARKVLDAAVLMDAMTGQDPSDSVSTDFYFPDGLFLPAVVDLSEKRFGYYTDLKKSDSLYARALNVLEAAGANLVALQRPDRPNLPLREFLAAEMKRALPAYLEAYPVAGIADLNAILDFNRADSLMRMPYGQHYLEQTAASTLTDEELAAMDAQMKASGQAYFKEAFQDLELNAVLDISNRLASVAAVARLPALTQPMGFREDGRPASLTWIGPTYTEKQLLNFALAFEGLERFRRAPREYLD